MLLESSQIPGELQGEREEPMELESFGLWLGLEPLLPQLWLPIIQAPSILGKNWSSPVNRGQLPVLMLQLFCATLTTPAKPCFYRKSLHIHDQLQDIFNKKKNVCNAETALPLNCSSAQQWEIPRASIFCVQSLSSISVRRSWIQWGSGSVPQGV